MAFARSILHSFVSAKADSGDATLLQPSNWNAAHSAAVSGATSGGIPYFDSATSEACSALLASGNVVLGGGAGGAPNTSPIFRAISNAVLFYNTDVSAIAMEYETDGSDTARLRIRATGLFAWGSTTADDVLDTGLSRTAAGEISFGTGAQGSAAGTCRAAAYKVGATAGASFGPGAVTSITVVNGIVTAIS